MILPDLASVSPVSPVSPVHLGGLHPYENALVLLVAFGPFVVIGLLARRERRRAADEHDAGKPAAQEEAQEAQEETQLDAGDDGIRRAAD